MNTLQRYLLRQFLPVCLVSALFFVLLLELGDLFANLWKYLANNVSAREIATILALYLPKCVSFSMPLAVLFASSYTMGTMHANNELTSVFSSGYPLYRLAMPLLAFGLTLSLGMFFFEDRLVIRTLGEKSELSRNLLNQDRSLSNTNIVVLSRNGRVLYMSDYYQDTEHKLYALTVISRDDDGRLVSVSRTSSAVWNGSEWIAEETDVYSVERSGGIRHLRDKMPLRLDEPPETFRRNTTSVDELSVKDAKEYIKFMRRAGLPHAEQLSAYYRRFSFPLTIFIVLLFSISLGGRFRKNIMLMSLLLSLSVAVVYYVVQMITMILSKWEYISPLAGAWIPVVLFVGLGTVSMRYART